MEVWGIDPGEIVLAKIIEVEGFYEQHIFNKLFQLFDQNRIPLDELNFVSRQLKNEIQLLNIVTWYLL